MDVAHIEIQFDARHADIWYWTLQGEAAMVAQSSSLLKLAKLETVPQHLAVQVVLYSFMGSTVQRVQIAQSLPLQAVT